MNTTGNEDPDKPLRLSFTQIDLYQTCPMHYKFRYILKIKAPKTAAPAFGQVIHNTLQQFYANLIQGKKTDKKMLFKVYDEYWKSEGYADQIEEQKYRKKGEKQLNDFYDRNKDTLKAPLAIEKDFVFPAKDILIAGKIDRIDTLSRNKIEIVDYKSGNPKTQKEADKDIQMTIYAAAAKKIFSGKEVERLSFYFLEANEIVSTTRTDEQIEETISRIKAIAGEIRGQKFNPVEGRYCTWCAYSWICPAKQPYQPNRMEIS